MENTLYYNDQETWRPQIGQILSDVLSPEVLSELQKCPLDDMWPEELNWLESIASSILGHNVNICSLVKMRFRDFFGYVAGHHACRTDDIESYYKRGLIPLSRVKANQELRGYFLNSRFPELTEEVLKEAIHEILPRPNGPDLREGKIFFGLDPDWLINHASEYLIGGGEYKRAVADNMSRLVNKRLKHSVKIDYSAKYGSIGRPTMFVCRVPLELISDDRIESIQRRLVCHYIRCSVHGCESYGRDVTITISEPLAPCYIIKHDHPEELLR